MVTAYREPDRGLGKFVMQSVIDSLTSGVPTVLVELRRLGRTLKHRATDILAFFDRPGTQQLPHGGGQRPPRTPTRISLRFRNLSNYIARSLLETGGFRNHLHLQMR